MPAKAAKTMTVVEHIETDGFELDVTLLEVSDAASLVNVTNDNCGSTCGACTTNAA